VARPIVIVGAGPAGIAMGIRLKRARIDDFVIVERSDGVGGTWHDNRYPGAACDVPSHLYAFSFAPNPDWSRKFSPQPEIERYLQTCVERFGLASHLRLSTEVTGADLDEASGEWRVHTSGGELAARALISGVGQLNRPRVPALPGLDDFAGVRMHSARWDPAFDFAGKRVAVIGTGASAVQIVPELATRAAHVTVLQRSPPYVIPRNDRAYRDVERWLFRNVPGWRRLYRARIYWELEARFSTLEPATWMARLTRWMALRHLREQIRDPALRDKLTPRDVVGCKRILISDDWYLALARPNVALVTAEIDRVTHDAVITRDGATHAADAIVLATGFETLGFLAPMRIRGRDGVELAAAWSDGAEAHRGILVAGFPNLFLLYGPNTNLGHNSILFMLECQSRYIVRCLAELDRRGARWLEVKRDAMARYNERLQHALARTAWATGCRSWYTTKAGKITNNYSGRTFEYWRRTREPDIAELDIA
jgi:cation diffusion facilitator CzcD-associated flavoprotein CzcO